MSQTAKNLLAQATDLTTIKNVSSSKGNSKKSLSVVYNHNGRRLQISKALSEALLLENFAQISIIESSGVVILGKKTSDNPNQCIDLNLKDSNESSEANTAGRKIAYSASAAYAIVTSFELDYSNCSSKSFSKISIDNSDPENPLAIITITEV